jgi:hypothetical protein
MELNRVTDAEIVRRLNKSVLERSRWCKFFIVTRSRHCCVCVYVCVCMCVVILGEGGRHT